MASVLPSRLDRATGDHSAVSIFSGCSRWPSWMDRTVQLQYLISGNNRSVRVNLGRTTAEGALTTARQLLQEGYMDVRICTPRGQILLSDEFAQLEG